MRFAPSTEAGKDGESEGEEAGGEEDEAARIARKREKALRKKNKKAQKYVRTWMCLCLCWGVGDACECGLGGWGGFEDAHLAQPPRRAPSCSVICI